MTISDVNYTSPTPNSNRVLMTVALNCMNQEEASDIYRTLQRMSGNESRSSQPEIIDRRARTTSSTASMVGSFRSLRDFGDDNNDGAEVVDGMGNAQAPTQLIFPQAVSSAIPIRDFRNQVFIVDNANPVAPVIPEAPITPEIPIIKPPTNPIEDLEIT